MFFVQPSVLSSIPDWLSEMAIYEFYCEKCDCVIEKIQAMDAEAPDCQCGGVMLKKLSLPAIIKIKWEGSYLKRSKGYKEGYKKEYLKSKGQEVWRDKIIDAESQA